MVFKRLNTKMNNNFFLEIWSVKKSRRFSRKINKRAQLSFFLLVGVVMVFFVGFSLFVVSSTKEKIQESSELAESLRNIKKDVLSIYLKQCADSALKNNLIKYLQYGFFPNLSISLDGNVYNISYVRYEGKDYVALIDRFYLWKINGKQSILGPPEWPFNYKYSDASVLQYGPITQLPPYKLLPLIYGIPNYFFISISQPSTLKELEFRTPLMLLLSEDWPKLESVMFDSRFKQISIDKLMSEDIAKDILNCIDLESLLKVTGAEYQIKNISIALSFFESKVGMIAEVSYSMRYVVSEKEFTDERTKISSSVDFPFRELYTQILNAIKRDLYDLSFNLKKSLQQIAWELGFDFSWVKYNNVFYYTLKYKKSLLKDINPELRFAIYNRPPVIYPVGEKKNYSNIVFNYVVKVNTPIIVKPIAIDPDEDRLTFFYSGWKTNSHLNVFYPFLSSETNEWMESHLYHNDCDIEPFAEKFASLIPKKGRCASVLPNYRDALFYSPELGILGWNILTITAKEIDSNMQDFEHVNVLVYDEPFNVKGKNLFEDVSPSWASLEDLYVLKFSGGAIFERNPVVEICKDSFCKNVSLGPEITLPLNLLYHNITRNNASKNDFFNGDMFNDGNPITLNVTLYTESSKVPRSLNITLKQCLPHRSTIPPYPFNHLQSFGLPTGEDYFSNHACCNEGGNIVSGTCFSHTFQVCGYNANITSFTDDSLNIDTTLFSSFNVINKPENPSEEIYNVFNVTVNSSCGNRGNICNGPTTETWQFAYSFSDISDDFDELCLGCVNGSLKPFSEITYEKYLTTLGFDIDATGFCKINFPVNNLTIGSTQSPSSEFYFNGQLLFEDKYRYLCNFTCDEGICKKTYENWCIDSNEFDSVDWDTLTMNDYYFNASGGLVNHSVSLDCGSVIDEIDTITVITPFGTSVALDFGSGNGGAVYHNMCYVISPVSQNNSEFIKQVPYINTTILRKVGCRKYESVSCSGVVNKSSNPGIFGNKVVWTLKPRNTLCKYGCNFEDKHNCCEHTEHVCNISTLGSAFTYHDIRYYCTFDAFNNSYKWVIYERPQEFCLDGIDNDLDGAVDEKDRDCDHKLCLKKIGENWHFGVVLNKTCYISRFLQYVKGIDLSFIFAKNDTDELIKYLYVFNISELNENLKTRFGNDLTSILDLSQEKKHDLNEIIISDDNLTSRIWLGENYVNFTENVCFAEDSLVNCNYYDVVPCINKGEYHNKIRRLIGEKLSEILEEKEVNLTPFFKIYSKNLSQCKNEVCLSEDLEQSIVCDKISVCIKNYTSFAKGNYSLYNPTSHSCCEPMQYLKKQYNSFVCTDSVESSNACWYFNGTAIESGLFYNGSCKYKYLYYNGTAWQPGLVQNAKCAIFDEEDLVAYSGISNGTECCDVAHFSWITLAIKNSSYLDFSPENLIVENCINEISDATESLLLSLSDGVDFKYKQISFITPLTSSPQNFACINITESGLQYPVRCQDGMICVKFEGNEFKKEKIGIFLDNSCNLNVKFFVVNSTKYPFEIVSLFDYRKEKTSEMIYYIRDGYVFGLPKIREKLFKKSLTSIQLYNIGTPINYYNDEGFFCEKDKYVVSEQSFGEIFSIDYGYSREEEDGEDLTKFKCTNDLLDNHFCQYEGSSGIVESGTCKVYESSEDYLCFEYSWSQRKFKEIDCENSFRLCYSLVYKKFGLYNTRQCLPFTTIPILKYNCDVNFNEITNEKFVRCELDHSNKISDLTIAAFVKFWRIFYTSSTSSDDILEVLHFYIRDLENHESHHRHSSYFGSWNPDLSGSKTFTLNDKTYTIIYSFSPFLDYVNATIKLNTAHR